jgi:hypothetical protein
MFCIAWPRIPRICSLASIASIFIQGEIHHAIQNKFILPAVGTIFPIVPADFPSPNSDPMEGVEALIFDVFGTVKLLLN